MRLEPPGPHVPAEPADVPGRRLALSRPPDRAPEPAAPVGSLSAGTAESLPLDARRPPGAIRHDANPPGHRRPQPQDHPIRQGQAPRRSSGACAAGCSSPGCSSVTGVAGVLYLLSTVDLPAPPRDGRPDHVRLRRRRCRSASATSANAMAAFHGSENRVEVSLDQVPEGHAGRGAGLGGPRLLRARRRRPGRHRPGRLGRHPQQGRRSQGGSTITQQYVKTVYLTSDRTLGRKIKEAAMAVKFEQKYSKQEILELYLNTIYFGRGAYGVQAASQAYFGLDVGDLGLSGGGAARRPHPQPAQRRAVHPPRGGEAAPADRPRRDARGGDDHPGRAPARPTPGRSARSTA